MPEFDSLYDDLSLLEETGLSPYDEERRKQEELSLLGGTGQAVMGGLGMLGMVLDTPGHIARSILGGSNPLTGLFNEEKRFYGEDLMDAWGIENPTGVIGELGLEIALDPLTYLTGGLSAAAKTSRATKLLTKTGKLRKIGDIVPVGRTKSLDLLNKMRGKSVLKMGIEPNAKNLVAGAKKAFAEGSEEFTKREIDHIDKWARLGLATEAGKRSGVSHRQLKKMMTVDDYITFHPDDIQREVTQHFTDLPRSHADYPAVRTGPNLGGWATRGKGTRYPGTPDWFRQSASEGIGAHLTWFGQSADWIPGSTKLASGMDKTGDLLRWSAPGRHVASLFSAPMQNARTQAVQQFAGQMAGRNEEALIKVENLVHRLGAELTEHPDYATGAKVMGLTLTPEPGGLTDDAYRQWMEMGTTQANRDLLQTKHVLSDSSVELLNRHRTEVRQILDDSFQRAQDSGMRISRTGDTTTGAFFPRRMVLNATKKAGQEVDIEDFDLIFDSVLDTAKKRAAPLTGIRGQTVRIKEILADPKFQELMGKAKTADVAQRANTYKDLETLVFTRYGDLFEGYEGLARNVGGRRITREEVQAAHVKDFVQHIFEQTTKQQRAEGLYAHSPISDLRSALAAMEDVTASNNFVVSVMGRHAMQTPTQAGALAFKERGFTNLHDALKSLNLQTNLFDKNGVRLDHSVGHISDLKEAIWNKFFKGRKEVLEGGSRNLDMVYPAGHARAGQISREATQDGVDKLLKDFWIPNDVAEDLLRTQKVARRPASGSLLDIYDGYITLMKAHLTTPWAAFAGRNYISGLIRNHMIGMNSRKSQKMAYQLLVGKMDKATGEVVAGVVDGALDAMPQLRKQLTERGMPHTDEAATKLLQEKVMVHGLEPERAFAYDPLNERIARTKDTELVQGLMPIEKVPKFQAIESPFSWNTVKTWLGVDEGGKAFKKDMSLKDRLFNWMQVEGGINLKGKRPLETKFGPIRAGVHLNTFIEGQLRVAPFLEGLMKGGSENAVARRVMDAQVDYATRKYTRFERTVMQRLFPFYKFRAGQTKWLPGEIAERPGGRIPKTIRAINKLRQGDEEFMPDYLAEGSSIALPGGIPGISPDDPTTHRYLSGLGLMFEDPLEMGRSPMMSAIAASAPPIKFGLEQAFNQSTFQGGRQLDQLRSANMDTIQNLMGIPFEERTVKGQQLGKAPGVAEHMLLNSPLARYMTTLRQATGPIPDLAQGKLGRLLPTMSGLAGLPRTVDVSKKVREAILRDRAQKVLLETGEAKEFERVYVPQERVIRTAQEEGPKAASRLLKIQAVLNRLAEEARARKVEGLGGSERAKEIRKQQQQLIELLRQNAGI